MSAIRYDLPRFRNWKRSQANWFQFSMSAIRYDLSVWKCSADEGFLSEIESKGKYQRCQRTNRKNYNRPPFVS